MRIAEEAEAIFRSRYIRREPRSIGLECEFPIVSEASGRVDLSRFGGRVVT